MVKNKSTKPSSSASASAPLDGRFNFDSERYRLPSKNKHRTTVDKRFKRLFTDDEFTRTSKVDRYGRKLESGEKKKASLRQLYQEEDEEDEDDDQKAGVSKKGDREVDDDDVIQRELRKADKKYDAARGGGFSSSESDSDSDDEDEDEDDDVDADDVSVELDTATDMQRFRDEQADVEEGEVTNRLALVNMDWDNVKSVDLFALFSSFVPAGGRLEKVSIYPSEFGKERMEREELEGPPKEIFIKKTGDEDDDFEGFDDSEDDSEDGDDDEDDDADSDEETKKELLQEGNDEDFDSDALRSYQIDRLRYYYAVISCSNKSAAQQIYEATDGTEYLSSSNFLDLRFIPDDTTFDDEPRDECTSVPANYKPIEFVTDALSHSKVKLTWDTDPGELSRKESMKNSFTGSKADLLENDLRAYLASDNESDDDEEEDLAPVVPEEETEEAPKLSKKEIARRKMRATLGLSDEPAPKPSKSGPVGDMEITFMPALSEKESAKAKGPGEEETTLEKYKRKERERKSKKKEKAVSKRESHNPDADEEASDGEPKGDLGFDDPFFTSEDPVKVSKTSIRKEDRLKKRAAKETEAAEIAAQKAHLELIMADDPARKAENLDHFDMKAVLKAEKLKRKKGKAAKKAASDQTALQQDFKMDVGDSRFKAVFDNPEFAIDPSNPKYQATESMSKLLEEGRKKRKVGEDEDERESKKSKRKEEDVGDLVSAIKRKSRR